MCRPWPKARRCRPCWKRQLLGHFAHTAQAAQKAALEWAEDGLAACQGADLIVAGIGGLFIGLSLAEKLNLPLLQAYYVPLTPTRAFAGALLPKPLPGPLRWLNRFSHHAVRQIMWQGSRQADNLARLRVLGLPKRRFLDRMAPGRHAACRFCMGLAHRLLPRQPIGRVRPT